MSGGPHTATIGQLPDELLSRILVAAATQPDGSINLRAGGLLSRVCRRWRALCFATAELWEFLSLSAPRFEVMPGERQRWLDGKLRLLTRVGPMVQHLHITDESAAQGMVDPLLRAVPCTLRSLSVRTRWGPHLSELPALLAFVRVRCENLARFELNASERAGSFSQAAQQLALPGFTAARLEAQLLSCLLASVAGLAASLKELKLCLHCADLPPLAPLTALRQLRRLEVAGGVSHQAQRQVPPPAQFPHLEEFDLRGLGQMQVAGTMLQGASCVAAPLRTLKLWGPEAAGLPALLEALRPPAAGPLERLFIDDMQLGGDASAAVVAVQGCTPHLASVRELDVLESPSVAPVLEPLLRQLPRLETLRLTNCGLKALPAGPYLSGLRTVGLAGNSLAELPPAVLHASRLQHLDLQGSRGLHPSQAALEQLLQALPELQLLDLSDTGIEEGAAEALKAAAAARGGLTVELPEYEPEGEPWWLDGEAGCGSSDSDSSDDGCPRYSWAGCAYASRW